jgi:hypothetical protein
LPAEHSTDYAFTQIGPCAATPRPKLHAGSKPDPQSSEKGVS